MEGRLKTLMDQAHRDLAAAGAGEAELRRANDLLAMLALHNPSGCRCDLGRGVVVELPANPHARGFRTAARFDSGHIAGRSH
jgi:hypothetical protein